MTVRPFTISVPEADLLDVKARLDRTRWPGEIPGSGWDFGSSQGYMQEIARYWRTGYDWRAQEKALNRFPHFKVDVDGLNIHFIHARGKGPRPLPLMVIHGWPSTFYEMHKIIGPLSDPAAHGLDPADSFDVIAPSLPGYGFSDGAKDRGMNTWRIADYFARLMVDGLGYRRFGAHGSDWGSLVTAGLGLNHAPHMAGIHMTSAPVRVDEAGLNAEQRKWWDAVQAYRRAEWGYVRLQSTKPQTLAYGLNDSPVGLAAWIIEKWRTWSDCGGDVERAYTKDELLTNVMIYWVTQSIGSSMRLYYESFRTSAAPPRSARIEVPTGVAAFTEIGTVPRELVAPVYNLQRYTVMERGGHFPAMENPSGLVSEIQAFFRPLR